MQNAATARYTPKTIQEPMYMATRFFEWCQAVDASPTDFNIGRWING